MPSSPTVWQRWLAHELLRLRTAAGLDRREVAEQLHCTTQKIGHLETGTVPPKTLELEKVLLPLFGVPQDRWPYYLQAARDARKKGWWEAYTESIPDWFSLYVGLEQGASDLHVWEPQLVHGLLQTEAYAQAIVRGGTAELTEEHIARRVEARLARQAILVGDSPIRMWVVLGEAALRSNVGGPAVMRAQLRHLLTVAAHPRLTLQILPGDVGAHPGMAGAFAVMEFPTEHDPGLAYVEHRSGALYMEDHREVKDHRIALEHLRGLALTPGESVDLVARLSKEA
ncbi:MAG TPA: helix-turn-helix transcriptional regulator [Actinokineospora sp.]|jgi:transcriptional regulator with XRE-family HTH domain|nr:helix-turn-helix transcriptional regulator [Actinokineospora sp.]